MNEQTTSAVTESAANVSPPDTPARDPGSEIPVFADPGEFCAQVIATEEERDPEASQLKGFIGGALGAAGAVLLFASLAALLGRWFGLMSIGIGYLVALGVRKLGKGDNALFGIIGATWALVACVVAHHLACCVVAARRAGVSVFEFIVNYPGGISQIAAAVLGPLDFALYCVAMYVGYRVSHDCVADKY